MSNVINNCHYSDVFSDLARVCPRFPVVTQDVIKGQTAATTTRSATARPKSLQYCAKDNVWKHIKKVVEYYFDCEDMNDDDKQGAAKKLTGDKFNELRFLDARENVAVSESLNMVSLHRKLKSEILV